VHKYVTVIETRVRVRAEVQYCAAVTNVHIHIIDHRSMYDGDYDMPVSRVAQVVQNSSSFRGAIAILNEALNLTLPWTR